MVCHSSLREGELWRLALHIACRQCVSNQNRKWPIPLRILGFSSLKLHVHCSPVAFLVNIPFVPVVCISLEIVNAVTVTVCNAAIRACRIRGLKNVTGAVMLRAARPGAVLVNIIDTATGRVAKD